MTDQNKESRVFVELYPSLRRFAAVVGPIESDPDDLLQEAVVEGTGGYVWVAEQAVITTEEGSWRGSVQAAEDRAAIPSGEAHYVGEGAYEGLDFHHYFFHADLGDEAEVRGWISGGA